MSELNVATGQWSAAYLMENADDYDIGGVMTGVISISRVMKKTG